MWVSGVCVCFQYRCVRLGEKIVAVKLIAKVEDVSRDNRAKCDHDQEDFVLFSVKYSSCEQLVVYRDCVEAVSIICGFCVT